MRVSFFANRSVFQMFPSTSKLAGPVRHSAPDPDTIVLACDRGLKWPLLFAIPGVGLLVAGSWLPPASMLFYFDLPGVCVLAVAAYFSMLRAEVVLSRKDGCLMLRPIYPLPGAKTTRISFSEIREFLVEAEFELGAGEDPFVWHLTAVTVDGSHVRLTWHFTLRPIRNAAEQASRITGKPVREQPDPWKSSTWSRWGYNFLS